MKVEDEIVGNTLAQGLRQHGSKRYPNGGNGTVERDFLMEAIGRHGKEIKEPVGLKRRREKARLYSFVSY